MDLLIEKMLRVALLGQLARSDRYADAKRYLPIVLLIVGCSLFWGCLLFVLAFLAFLSFWYAAEGRDLYRADDLKWAVENREKLVENLGWKLTLLASGTDKTKIINGISAKYGIDIVDESSDAGMMKDLVLLKGLDSAFNLLPDELIRFVDNKVALKISIYDPGIKVTTKVFSVYATGSGGACYLGDGISWNNIVVGEGSEFISIYKPLFLHEMGHALCRSYFGNSSSSYYWREFIGGINENPPTEYAHENYREDFAETFQLYWAEPKYLKKICPQRYAEMERVIIKSTS